MLKKDLFKSQQIPRGIKEFIIGRSYKKEAEAYIDIDDLLYIPLLHYNITGTICFGEMIINKEIAKIVSSIFLKLFLVKYPIQSIRLIDYYDASDEKSMRANNSSCFCFRNIYRNSKLSKHAFGMAIDLNPLYNPYVKIEKNEGVIVQPFEGWQFLDRGKNFCYKMTSEDFAVKCFKKEGFKWGGDWSNPVDYQHFEI